MNTMEDGLDEKQEPASKGYNDTQGRALELIEKMKERIAKEQADVKKSN